MTFAQRVENVVTYAVASLIDWVAFHRRASLLVLSHSNTGTSCIY
jgi:hypothetical protein